MKSSRFKYAYRDSASKLHRAVGKALRGNIFGGFKIYQEFPVSKVNPTFRDNRCKFDWVILDLKMVIECMGEQHTIPVRWSKETSQEEAIDNLHSIQTRDLKKKQAAEDAGYIYITIPYDDLKLIDEEYLWDKYLAAVPTIKQPPEEDIISNLLKSEKPSQDPIKKKLLEKSRQIRKERYNRIKQWLNEQGR